MLRTCFDSTGRGCGRTLPLETSFYRQGRNPDGSVRYTSLCRECNREKQREWREANPERVSAYNERDWIVHRDKRSEANAVYYAEHAEELCARERERYANLDDEQRDRIRERQREAWPERAARARRTVPIDRSDEASRS